MSEAQAASTEHRSTLAARLLAGEARALARAITSVENAQPGSLELLRAIRGHTGHAWIIGITGPPGVGKSTLVNGLIGAFRERRQTVAVLAVDPSSPYSGGAILGDRIRMTGSAADPEVFVRSLSSRGHVGGLSTVTSQVIDLVDASGKDIILVETVGAGQSDVEIVELAGTTVVVSAPGSGDDIQAIKSGILEIASILVVNKADHPLATQTRGYLERMLRLRHSEERVPLLMTTASKGEGLAELADAIARLQQQLDPQQRARNALRRRRALVLNHALNLTQAHISAASDESIETLARLMEEGALGFEALLRPL